MNLLLTIINLILCHLIGDYVLQNDFIAKTKGENWYHLLVHCLLYCLPFLIMFGLVWELLVVFIAHIIIDSLKARYKLISYTIDQVLHYSIILLYLI